MKHHNRETWILDRVARVALPLLLVACGNKPAPEHPDTTAAHAPEKPVEEPVWSYQGDTGPERWGKLDPSFATCDSGQAQSPIDLPAQPAGTAPAIDFHYQESPLRVVNKGYTVEVELDDDAGQGSAIELDGTRYHLRQFHFHHPSEHTVAGQARDLAVHLVHASDAGELAVVGVFLEAGEQAHPLIQDILAHVPRQAGGHAAPEDVSVNPAALLPEDRAYYRYRGSLTTPPCTEGVRWHVFAQPITVSAEQAAALAELMPENARPALPLHDRTID